jgi:hypothetical protein
MEIHRPPPSSWSTTVNLAITHPELQQTADGELVKDVMEFDRSHPHPSQSQQIYRVS